MTANTVNHGVSLKESHFCDKNVKKSVWWRLAIGFIIAGQLMVFSLGINLHSPEVFSTAYWIIHTLLLGGASGVFLLLGWPLCKKTWQHLFAGQITVEWMFFLSAVGALGASMISTITGKGAVFYEVVAIVLCIYTLGKTVGLHAKNQVKVAIYELRQKANLVRVKLSTGDVIWQEAHEVCMGAHMLVEAGEMIPMDGVIIDGQSYIEEAAVTGEAIPRVYHSNDRVLAGMYSIDGRLSISVNGLASDRLLEKLLKHIENGVEKPSILEKRANRMMHYFVPCIMSISILTFVFWAVKVDWVIGLFNSMAVLLVACPCAFGLATPIGVWTGLWNLSRRGLIIKTGLFIDALIAVNTWVFDKTGTLTDPQLGLGDWSYASGWEVKSDWIHGIVYTIEAGLNHPIARAFERILIGNSDFFLENREWFAGKGVQGMVRHQDKLYAVRIGEPQWLLNENQVSVINKSIGIEIDGVIVAWVNFKEILRPSAQKIFEYLLSKKQNTVILTGDVSPQPLALSGALMYKGLNPMAKIQWVKDCQKSGGHVIFVGDGLNDAGVMDIANGSVGIHGGSMLTTSVAQAVLLGENLDILRVAHQVAHNIYHSLKISWLIAISYNLLGVGFAVVGHLHPVLAACIMAISSGIVAYRAYNSATIVV